MRRIANIETAKPKKGFNMLKSIFSLINKNQGLFKSKKQARFMLSKADSNGLYVESQSLHFGDYDGRTSRNTATVEWRVLLCKDGVQSIHKATSKGLTEYWVNNGEYYAKAQAKALLSAQEKARFKAEALEQFKKDYAELKESYDIVHSVVVKGVNLITGEPVPQCMIDLLKDNNKLSEYNEKINQLMAWYQAI